MSTSIDKQLVEVLKPTIGGEGRTAKELAKLCKVHIDTMRTWIATGIEEGTVELAGRKRIQRIDGTFGTSAAFRLVKGKK